MLKVTPQIVTYKSPCTVQLCTQTGSGVVVQQDDKPKPNHTAMRWEEQNNFDKTHKQCDNSAFATITIASTADSAPPHARIHCSHSK